MTSKILRVGALGTGRVSRHAHIPAYAGLKDIRLAAVYDTNPSAAQQARDEYLALVKGDPERSQIREEVVICQSAEELLGQVDLVDICAPVRWHARYAAMALESNVHVMTEKPMARTWWEAKHVADIARRSKAQFQLSDDNLFIPRYRALRNVIESGMIGEVQTIWLSRGSHGGEIPWFWQPLEAGGGCVMDYGTHAVTSTWFLVGYDKVPTEVRSLGIQVRHRTRIIGGRFQQTAIDDDAHFKVRFVNPRNGDWSDVIVEATWSWPELGPNGNDVRGYIEVQGSIGTASGYVDSEDRHFLRIKHRSYSDERLIPLEATLTERESFRAEINNFVRSIEAGVPSILNAEVGLGVMGVLNCAQLSELRHRISVSPQALTEFSQQLAGDAQDPWTGADRIITELVKPYQA